MTREKDLVVFGFDDSLTISAVTDFIHIKTVRFVVRMIHQMFQKAFKAELIPKKRTPANITLLLHSFNKRVRRKCGNYRGVSMLPSIGRLYGKTIRVKMEKEIGNKIGDDQAGFTTEKS